MWLLLFHCPWHCRWRAVLCVQAALVARWTELPAALTRAVAAAQAAGRVAVAGAAHTLLQQVQAQQVRAQSLIRGTAACLHRLRLGQGAGWCRTGPLQRRVLYIAAVHAPLNCQVAPRMPPQAACASCPLHCINACAWPETRLDLLLPVCVCAGTEAWRAGHKHAAGAAAGSSRPACACMQPWPRCRRACAHAHGCRTAATRSRA